LAPRELAVVVLVLPEFLMLFLPPFWALGLRFPLEVCALLVLVALPPVVAEAVPPVLPVELAELLLSEFFCLTVLSLLAAGLPPPAVLFGEVVILVLLWVSEAVLEPVVVVPVAPPVAVTFPLVPVALPAPPVEAAPVALPAPPVAVFVPAPAVEAPFVALPAPPVLAPGVAAPPAPPAPPVPRTPVPPPPPLPVVVAGLAVPPVEVVTGVTAPPVAGPDVPGPAVERVVLLALPPVPVLVTSPLVPRPLPPVAVAAPVVAVTVPVLSWLMSPP
jgi:hypothetical protein